MPQCVDYTTASNRPVIFLPTYLTLQAIAGSSDLLGNGNGNGEPDELTASKAALQAATDLVVDVPFRFLEEPEVGFFYGEVHMSWTRGPKQILVMCFPNRGPLLHHYMRIPGRPSEHDIEDATAARLAHWLEWLRA